MLNRFIFSTSAFTVVLMFPICVVALLSKHEYFNVKAFVFTKAGRIEAYFLSVYWVISEQSVTKYVMTNLIKLWRRWNQSP